ncbi:MAG: hypothetical protein ABIZ80_24165 [Bryobacteraceae bacterium]
MNEDPIEAPDFWKEQQAEDRFDMRKQLLRWGLTFAILFGGVALAFWWSGSAIHFGASRVSGETVPTYEISGLVTDALTGTPIPWPEVADETSGRGPFFTAESQPTGRFRLLTLAEPHQVLITANGYQPRRAQVGNSWFFWWPKGSAQLDVQLSPQ